MPKKIGLWNPYLDTIGGGEKHLFQICNFFVRNGYELTVFWNKNIQKQIEQKLSHSSRKYSMGSITKKHDMVAKTALFETSRYFALHN
ncbi:MAG: hypothetical protein U0525_00305 [Patescibacteria group bacterium]